MNISQFGRCASACIAFLVVACAPRSEAPGSSLPPATVEAPPTVAKAAGATGAADGKGLIQSSLLSEGRPLDLSLKAVPGEFLVKFRKGMGKSEIGEVLRKSAPQSVHAYRLVPELRLVKVADGAAAQRAVEKLRARADVEYVEPNYIRTIRATPNDTSFGQQWAMNNVGQTGFGTPGADIDALRAWDITTGSSDVVVAVVDSGSLYTHPDLADNMWTNDAECNANGIDDDGNGYVDDCHGIDTFDHDSDPRDEEGHGTHVAGIIGARGNNGIGVAGVAWNVKILPCKFMNMFGQGSDAGAIECLDYIAALKSRGVNIIATNNSWGSFWPGKALYDAIRAQMDIGILFVTAAGNDGGFNNDQSAASYPCSFNLPNILCVANFTDTDVLSRHSTRGPSTVHLAAPGEAIYSTHIRYEEYDTLSGTSMAAPHVAGALVLLKAQQPTRDWRALKNLVMAGTEKLSYDVTISEGRLNLYNSLTCTNSELLARLRPFKGDDNVVAPGAHVLLQALHIRCDQPAGNVTVTLNPGGTSLTLLDDGQGDDLVAGDGIYTYTWIPQSGGNYQLSFPEIFPEVVDYIVDAMLKPGFPVYSFESTGMYQGGAFNHTLVGNIDDDPELEIMASGLASGPLYVWNHDGTRVPGWDQRFDGLAAYPALGEFDGNPARQELQVNYWGTYGDAFIYAPGAQIFPGWPVESGVPYPATAVDLDGDGRDEVVSQVPRHFDASLVLPYNSWIPFSPTAIADLDRDGNLDMVFANNTTLYAIDRFGELKAGFPAFDARADGFSTTQTPVLGDVDADGDVEIIIASRTQNQPLLAQVHVYSSRGVLERTRVLPTYIGYMTVPALADLTGDGIPEILIQTEKAMYALRGDDLTDLPGWPVDLGNVDLSNYHPVVGDVDGDGLPDVVTIAHDSATSPGYMYVYDRNGVAFPGFPKRMGDVGSGMTPAIADIDLDGRNDIVVALSPVPGTSRKLWVYDLHGAPNHGPLEWPQYMGSPSHRGYYELGKNLPTQAYLTARVDGNGTITSNDGRINCGADCIERYGKGATVTLTASPAPGGKLTAWRGACMGQGNPCVVTVSKYTEVGADFTTRTLTVSPLGQGEGRIVSQPAGIDCGATCSAEFTPGQLVTITAEPTHASYFDGWADWLGECAGSSPSCTLRMDRARSATAIFRVKPVMTVHLIGDGEGQITSSPAGIDCHVEGGPGCSAPFLPDELVTLTAEGAAPQFRFRGWSNSCYQYDNGRCVIRMGALNEAYAIFETHYGVAVTLAGSGTGVVTSSPAGLECGTNCVVEVSRDTHLTLTATPAADSWLSSWSGACTGTSTVCAFDVQSMYSTTATFDLKPVLTVTKTGTGTGTVTSPAGIDCGADCSEPIMPGTNVALTATPAADSDFAGWSNAGCAQSTCSLLAFQVSQTLTATFSLKTHALNLSLAGTGSGTVSSAPAGINCGADCSETFTHGTSVTLTATASAGSTFADWSGACAGSGATCTLAMSEARTTTANFRANAPSGGGGSSSGGKGGGGRLDWIALAFAALLVLRRLCAGSRQPRTASARRPARARTSASPAPAA